MNQLINMALDMISHRPDIANNPNAQEMINVIRTGDSKRGTEIAQNLCNTFGESPNDAIIRAKRFFNIQ